MARKLKPEEARLWSHVASTVKPRPGMALPTAEAAAVKPKTDPKAGPAHLPVAPSAAKPARQKPPPPPDPIEPGRKRRMVRGRDPLEARIDLHFMTHDRARAALEAFLLRAHDEGVREVLVITGKGTLGEGILRRQTPEWLAAPPLRAIVAGVSKADRRHGGDGALYVALKGKARP
ncbi:MAG: Smr/MutS family protein [Caulobacter sp.]|nr:Smr/MutS family protein [Caulobacter sp.]